MTSNRPQGIPIQKMIRPSIENIPIEYFKWGTYPDHFKIDMPHRHEFSELLFFKSGGVVHEMGYRDYDVKSGSLHYIPKSTVHFLKRDIHSDGFTIAFDTGYLEHNKIRKIFNPLKYEQFALNLSEDKFTRLMDQAQIIIQSIKQEKGYYKEKCFLLSLELLINSIASELYKSKEKDARTTESSLIRDFKYLLKTNIHAHHELTWYAHELRLSPKYLGNQIKNKMGISAKKYMNQCLLISVKQALLETEKTNKHIAMDHNYSPSTLARLFKIHVGHTMSAYRSYKKDEK